MIFVFGCCFLQYFHCPFVFSSQYIYVVFGLIPYDSTSQNFWIRLSVDVSNGNLLVIGQAGELWFPPSKTQPNVVCKAIFSLLFPGFISVYRCKFGWSVPINNSIFLSCGLSNGISLRWLYFLLTDDAVTGEVKN